MDRGVLVQKLNEYFNSKDWKKLSALLEEREECIPFSYLRPQGEIGVALSSSKFRQWDNTADGWPPNTTKEMSVFAFACWWLEGGKQPDPYLEFTTHVKLWYGCKAREARGSMSRRERSIWLGVLLFLAVVFTCVSAYSSNWHLPFGQ